MSDDILHQGATVPATPNAEEVQPSQTPEAEGQQAEGTGASETKPGETEQQAAERIVQERKVRQERARRNKEAAFNRLRSERDQLQQVVMDMARRNAGGPQDQGQQQRPQDAPPKREDYATWEQYEDARIDWRAERKAMEAAARRDYEMQSRMAEARRQQFDSQLTQAHVERVEKFAQAVPDFADVTDRDDIVIPEVAAEAIKSAPNSPEILYAIGRDPQIAARLHGMSPAQQAMFVGQLSAAMALRTQEVSRAPEPGKPVAGKSSPVTSLSDATSYDDFVKVRRKQISGRR